MEKNEKISRRDALKRMSKTAMAVAVASVLPSVSAFADPPKYANYDNYKNYGNYYNYKNYDDYSNYHNYGNYSNYSDCN